MDILHVSADSIVGLCEVQAFGNSSGIGAGAGGGRASLARDALGGGTGEWWPRRAPLTTLLLGRAGRTTISIFCMLHHGRSEIGLLDFGFAGVLGLN